MSTSKTIIVRFAHPYSVETLEVEVGIGLAASEAITHLIEMKFIEPADAISYYVFTTTDQCVSNGTTFAQAGIKTGDTLGIHRITGD